MILRLRGSGGARLSASGGEEQAGRQQHTNSYEEEEFLRSRTPAITMNRRVTPERHSYSISILRTSMDLDELDSKNPRFLAGFNPRMVLAAYVLNG